jgi:hypothetical protein
MAKTDNHAVAPVDIDTRSQQVAQVRSVDALDIKVDQSSN